MKTPEEIKKALKQCSDPMGTCYGCPFDTLYDTLTRCAKNVEALEYIEQLEERIAIMEEGSGWISVKDRLPDAGDGFIGKTYICKTNATGENKGVMPLKYCKVERHGKTFTEWRMIHGRACAWEVTHWMPLPEPPKKKRENE